MNILFKFKMKLAYVSIVFIEYYFVTSLTLFVNRYLKAVSSFKKYNVHFETSCQIFRCHYVTKHVYSRSHTEGGIRKSPAPSCGHFLKLHFVSSPSVASHDQNPSLKIRISLKHNSYHKFTDRNAVYYCRPVITYEVENRQHPPDELTAAGKGEYSFKIKSWPLDTDKY